jgi:hypothetical protein
VLNRVKFNTTQIPAIEIVNHHVRTLIKKNIISGKVKPPHRITLIMGLQFKVSLKDSSLKRQD